MRNFLFVQVFLSSMEFGKSNIQFSLYNDKTFLYIGMSLFEGLYDVFGDLIQCFFKMITLDLFEFNIQASNQYVIIIKLLDEKIRFALYIGVDNFWWHGIFV